LPEPDQQRALLPRAVPRRPRLGRAADNGGDEDRGGARNRGDDPGQPADGGLHPALAVQRGGGAARGRRGGGGGAPLRQRAPARVARVHLARVAFEALDAKPGLTAGLLRASRGEIVSTSTVRGHIEGRPIPLPPSELSDGTALRAGRGKGRARQHGPSSSYSWRR